MAEISRFHPFFFFFFSSFALLLLSIPRNYSKPTSFKNKAKIIIFNSKESKPQEGQNELDPNLTTNLPFPFFLFSPPHRLLSHSLCSPHSPPSLLPVSSSTWEPIRPPGYQFSEEKRGEKMFRRRNSLQESSDDEMEPPTSIKPDRRISVSAESIDPTTDQDSDRVRLQLPN